MGFRVAREEQEVRRVTENEGFFFGGGRSQIEWEQIN